MSWGSTLTATAAWAVGTATAAWSVTLPSAPTGDNGTIIFNRLSGDASGGVPRVTACTTTAFGFDEGNGLVAGSGHAHAIVGHTIIA